MAGKEIVKVKVITGRDRDLMMQLSKLIMQLNAQKALWC